MSNANATTLIRRLRMIGLQAEADIVEVVWQAIQRDAPQGALGLLELAGRLAEASDRLPKEGRDLPPRP